MGARPSGFPRRSRSPQGGDRHSCPILIRMNTLFLECESCRMRELTRSAMRRGPCRRADRIPRAEGAPGDRPGLDFGGGRPPVSMRRSTRFRRLFVAFLVVITLAIVVRFARATGT